MANRKRKDVTDTFDEKNDIIKSNVFILRNFLAFSKSAQFKLINV